MSGWMIELVAALIPSVALGWLILRYRGHHEQLTADSQGGPQKIHDTPVPRIGGLMIFVGFVTGIISVACNGHLGWSASLAVVICTVPAFGSGLFEDITKHGGVLFRLAATFLSAGLAFWLLDARLDRLDFPQADELLRYMPVSLAFTMFAAAGVSQSINIIDGLNGLATFVGMIALAAIGLIAWQLADPLVFCICLAGLGGLLGFAVWNFPRGLIFCGDGGAYFVGFLIAEVSVLLVHRHHEVSAWFPLILSAYPVWETLFSIYRRKLVTGKAAMRPDALHFHSLVYRWVSLINATRGGRLAAWQRNAISALLCACLPLAAAAMALAYWNETLQLSLTALAFALAYVLVYRELARPTNWRRAKRLGTARRITRTDPELRATPIMPE